MRANLIVTTIKNIGVYATGNQNRKRPISGILSAKKHFDHIYSLKNVPPPSETIFISKDKNGQKIFYNSENYFYAPEIELYLRIADMSYDCYYDNGKCVIRKKSLKNKTKWMYFADHYFIIEKYKRKVLLNTYLHSYLSLSQKAVQRYLIAKLSLMMSTRATGIQIMKEELFPPNSNNKESESLLQFRKDIIQEIGYILFYLLCLCVSIFYGVKMVKSHILRPTVDLFKRFALIILLIANNKKEPNFSYSFLFRYLMYGGIYPEFQFIDFKPQINVYYCDDLKCAKVNNDSIAYPIDWKDIKIKQNLSNIMNEQRSDSPHCYLSISDVGENWIIYDLGAAEGFQSKMWIKKAKHIVIFEPSTSNFKALKYTFRSEILDGKITLINEGVSLKEEHVTIGSSEIFHLDSLDNLIEKYDLPYPTYIKADIEGQELNFLRGANNTLDSNMIRYLDICTYHRPDDEHKIDDLMRKYNTKKTISNGFMLFNRNGYGKGSLNHIYHPVIRKVLARYHFNKKMENK
ncbi:hypothetical protein RJ53_01000 [Methanocalculus chunghsingensis]|uniref:Methyltransferase FkbM domain-containing protein n=2 Tax=Methanocalculus chunghsingensis TaxID=156457 RepID=A0A8J8B4J7_9EURY|nr:hypothetical protein [Methanocalculus chunghsingensis]